MFMASSSANFFSLLGDVGFFFFFGCCHCGIVATTTFLLYLLLLLQLAQIIKNASSSFFFLFFLFFFFCFFLMCLLPSFTILLFSFVCSDECEVIINVTEKSNASFISKFKLKKNCLTLFGWPA